MNKYSQEKSWDADFTKRRDLFYPAEMMIRIFKGIYPNLDLDKNFEGKNICDLSCGDGRHLIFFDSLGMNVFGTEITELIVNVIKENLKATNVSGTVKVGQNGNIPFEDGLFDYLTSWNTCYYMGEGRNFDDHLKDFARMLKKDGYFILSIPKKTSFLFLHSKPLDGYDDLRIITNDYFQIRNGAVLRMFNDEKEIEEVFSKYFKNFIFASDEDDCFGLEYNFHYVICQKK